MTTDPGSHDPRSPQVPLAATLPSASGKTTLIVADGTAVVPDLEFSYPQVRTITVVLATLVTVLDQNRFDYLHDVFREALLIMDATSTLSIKLPLSSVARTDLSAASTIFTEYILNNGIPSLVFAPTYASILLTLQHHTGPIPLSAPQMLVRFLNDCPSAKHLHLYMQHIVAAIENAGVSVD